MRSLSSGLRAVAILPLLAAGALAQSPVAVLSVPAQVNVQAPVILSTVGSVSPGAPVQVVFDPGSADPNVAVVPVATPDGKGGWTSVGAMVSFPKTGVYRPVAVAVGNGKYAVQVRDVTVGTVPPVPPVPPTPVPPTPTPTVGLARVVFVYETSANLTPAQLAVLRSQDVRTWMDLNVGKDSKGLPAWRFWDKDQILADQNSDWAGYWSRAKAAVGSNPLPQVAVFGTNGSVQAVALPGTEQDTIALLTKFKGN